MDKTYSIIPLFAAPVFSTTLDPVSEEIKDYLKSVEFERMESNNGYYSTNKYILNSGVVKPLKDEIHFLLDLYLKDVLQLNRTSAFFQMTNSWVVKHAQDDWGQMHVHTNCLISGILYLDVKERSGDLVFHKSTSHQNLFPLSVDFDIQNANLFNSKTWRFVPENNQLFFFPSNLLHSVTRNISGEDRYSLAFNFFPRGRLGEKEFELYL